MKCPITKPWLIFLIPWFHFFNPLIFRCSTWRLILVCLLVVRVLSSITLHSRCLLSFNRDNAFRSFWILGLSFMMSLTIFRMMLDYFSHWMFSFGFVPAVSAAKFIWISIKVSIFRWCVCVSCFGYEQVTNSFCWCVFGIWASLTSRLYERAKKQ